MRNTQKPKQPQPIRIDAAMIEKIRARLRETAARRDQRLIQERKLENERLQFKHSLAGEILPNCSAVPLQDLAARWKVSPGMLVEAAENGLFDIVIIEHHTLRDYLYLNKARWPYGEKSFYVPSPGIVHTLSPGRFRMRPTPQLYFPVEEISRVEQSMDQGAPGIVSLGPRWVCIKDAATHHGKSTKTIRNWIDSGKVKSKRGPGGGPLVLLE